MDSPLYRGLKVSKEGRDIYVESSGELSGAIGFNSALSLPIVIDQLVPKLAAAIDGNPQTNAGRIEVNGRNCELQEEH